MDTRARGIRIFGRNGMTSAEFSAILASQGGLHPAAGGLLAGPPQGGRSPDAAKIEAAYVGFKATLDGRRNAPEAIAPRIATIVETDNVLDRSLWLNSIPKMKLWLGDKTLSMLRAESLAVVTRAHETSIVVPKHDILNDKFGLYRRGINQLADSYVWALDELAIGMIVAGINGVSLGTTYDGQNLIDTDHTAMSSGGAAQSNKVTGALSSTTYALARQRYLEFKDENGTPQNLGNKRMRLLIGPANAEIANTLINQDIAANGSRNMNAGTSDLIVSPWISAGTRYIEGVAVTLTGFEWALIPEDSAAVLIHVKRGPEFLEVESGEFAFRTGKYLYGIEAEFGAAYGAWQEIVGGPGV